MNQMATKKQLYYPENSYGNKQIRPIEVIAKRITHFSTKIVPKNIVVGPYQEMVQDYSQFALKAPRNAKT